MNNNNNQFNFLDLLTILSFIIGLWALELAKQNLAENRVQSKDSEEILHQLEFHLRSQDELFDDLSEHLEKQDKVLFNGKEE